LSTIHSLLSEPLSGRVVKMIVRPHRHENRSEYLEKFCHVFMFYAFSPGLLFVKGTPETDIEQLQKIEKGNILLKVYNKVNREY
jgi:hypothetical protein